MSTTRRMTLLHKWLLSLILLTAFFMAVRAQAQQACVLAFQSLPVEVAPVKAFFGKDITLEGVRLVADRGVERLSSKKDPKYNEKLGQLLNMLTDTLYVNASEKVTIEKGELRLAKILPNGVSIEFEYTGDLRSEKQGLGKAFRLTKIMAIKPNGQTVTISKDPLTDDGRHLRQSEFLFVKKSMPVEGSPDEKMVEIAYMEPDKQEKLTGWIEQSGGYERFPKPDGKKLIQYMTDNAPAMAGADQAKIAELLADVRNVEVPVVLSGPLLDDLLKNWLDRLELISRGEWQGINQGSSVRHFALLGTLRSSVAWWKDRVSKKVSGIVIAAILVGGGMMAVDKLKDVYHEWNAAPTVVYEQVESSGFTQTDARVMAQVLNELTDQQWNILDPRLSERIYKRMQQPNVRTPIDEAYQFEEFIKQSIELETRLGSSVRTYLGSSQNNSESLLRADVSQFQSGLAIYLFDAQERVVITSIQEVKGSTVPSVRVLIIRKEQHSALYDILKKRLKTSPKLEEAG